MERPEQFYIDECDPRVVEYIHNLEQALLEGQERFVPDPIEIPPILEEYSIHISDQASLEQAKGVFRAMKMKLPVKIKGKWWAVKCVETKTDRYDVTEVGLYGLAPIVRHVSIATITPYHTKTR